MNGTPYIIAPIAHLFIYEPSDGSFRWANSGELIKFRLSNGYLVISVKHKTYRAHRIAWFIHYGIEPGPVLDHINRDRTDNRIANLREVDTRGNAQNIGFFNFQNKTSKYMGVCFHKKRKKWRAQIKHLGRQLLIGEFRTEEEAAEAYLSCKKSLHSYYVHQ